MRIQPSIDEQRLSRNKRIGDEGEGSFGYFLWLSKPTNRNMRSILLELGQISRQGLASCNHRRGKSIHGYPMRSQCSCQGVHESKKGSLRSSIMRPNDST